MLFPLWNIKMSNFYSFHCITLFKSPQLVVFISPICYCIIPFTGQVNSSLIHVNLSANLWIILKMAFDGVFSFQLHQESAASYLGIVYARHRFPFPYLRPESPFCGSVLRKWDFSAERNSKLNVTNETK